MSISNSNDIQKANTIIDSMLDSQTVKRVKKDRGLMERSEVENKIIITEDNRQVIFG